MKGREGFSRQPRLMATSTGYPCSGADEPAEVANTSRSLKIASSSADPPPELAATPAGYEMRLPARWPTNADGHVISRESRNNMLGHDQPSTAVMWQQLHRPRRRRLQLQRAGLDLRSTSVHPSFGRLEDNAGMRRGRRRSLLFGMRDLFGGCGRTAGWRIQKLGGACGFRTGSRRTQWKLRSS